MGWDVEHVAARTDFLYDPVHRPIVQGRRDMNQRDLVRASLGDVHQHDVSSRPRQLVEPTQHFLEEIREIVREEIRRELMARDRRSGSGD